MAEPGDPTTPEMPASPAVDHDAEIGFSSPASLQGQLRRPIVEVAPEPDPEPDLFAADPAPAPPAFEPEPEPHPEPVVAPEPVRSAPSYPATAGAVVTPSPSATPSWAVETPQAERSYPRGRGPVEAPAEVPGGLGLYSVYALILFAVPTLGVSAVIALLAVTGRPAPAGAVASSHFIFQQRTLWVGAVAALIGAVLIAVGLGVFVLFALAVWLILRGATGVLKLKAGRAVENPRSWLL